MCGCGSVHYRCCATGLFCQMLHSYSLSSREDSTLGQARKVLGTPHYLRTCSRDIPNVFYTQSSPSDNLEPQLQVRDGDK